MTTAPMPLRSMRIPAANEFRFGTPPWIAVSLLVLALAAFANTLTHDFVWDDVHLIEKNDNLATPELPDLLTQDFGVLAAEGTPSGLYRPVVMTSFWLQKALFGPSPVSFHAVNVLAHVVTTWLVFILARGLGMGVPLAWVAAALFAVHPVHTETVTWISGRTDGFAAMFLLASVLLYERGRRGHPPAYVASLAMAVLAMGSKETALVLPVLLVGLEIVSPIPGRRVLAIVRAVVPYGIFAMLFVLRLLTLRATILDVAPIFPEEATFFTRAWTAASAGVGYLGKFVWPVGLNAEFEPAVVHVPGIVEITAILFAFVLAGFALLRARRRPAFAFGVGLAFVTWFPASSLAFPIGETAAERYIYLPSVGLLLAAVALLPKRFARPAVAAVLPILAVSIALTIDRNRDWRSPFVFHEVTARTAPDHWRARFKFGYVLQQRGRHYASQRNFPVARRYYERALVEYRASVEASPEELDPRKGVGVVLLDLDRYDEAVRELRATLRRDPEAPDVGWHLGLALLQIGELDEAYPLLVSADEAEADRLATAARRYSAEGRHDDAIRLLRIAVARDPNLAIAYQQLATAYAESGPAFFARAAECYRQAIALDETDANSMSNLAMVLARSPDPRVRNFEEALAWAERAASISPTPHSLLVYADLLFYAGLREECREVLQRGLAFEGSAAAAFRSRLERLDALATSPGTQPEDE